MDVTQLIIPFCTGIGLAAATGFRVFIPLLITGLAMRFGGERFFLPGSEFLWLTSDSALTTFVVAAFVEMLAYKIPWLDHGLDVLMTPLAISVGSMLVAVFLKDIQDPVVKYSLAVIFGGGATGIFQGSTIVGRIFSTKTTGGLANPIFSFLEAVFSILVSLFAIFLPIFCILVLVLIFIYFLNKRPLAAKSLKV